MMETLFYIACGLGGCLLGRFLARIGHADREAAHQARLDRMRAW